MRGAIAWLAALIILSRAAAARADDDGVYGRFDGDLTLRADAGVAFGAGGPALDAALTALYLGTCGPYLHYTDSLGSDSPRVARSLAFGVHLQPFFLARYGTGGEHGPAHLDLLLDSFAFEVGAAWDAPVHGGIASRPGLEIAIGLALPILPRETGPVIGVRGALRWRDADLSGPRDTDAIDRGALLSITLGWRHVLPAHLVDPFDRASR